MVGEKGDYARDELERRGCCCQTSKEFLDGSGQVSLVCVEGGLRDWNRSCQQAESASKSESAQRLPKKSPLCDNGGNCGETT